MKRLIPVLVFGALLAPSLHAQTAPPSLSGGIKQSYMNIKSNLTKAAEKMPEEGYSFQPTKEERNFGAWVAHVADAQMGTCSRIGGAPRMINAGQMTAKADLVAALAESFTACDAVYDNLTDANANDAIAGGRAPAIRAVLLTNNIAHDNECYGSMAVYMRLKGVVPPSSEGGGMPAQAPAAPRN